MVFVVAVLAELAAQTAFAAAAVLVVVFALAAKPTAAAAAAGTGRVVSAAGRSLRLRLEAAFQKRAAAEVSRSMRMIEFGRASSVGREQAPLLCLVARSLGRARGG